jgi:hypothetical protein
VLAGGVGDPPGDHPQVVRKPAFDALRALVAQRRP